MIYDGDAAGEIATLKKPGHAYWRRGKCKVVPLPKGMDPDTLVRQEGISSLSSKLQNAKSLFDYKLEVLKFRHNIKDAHGKSKIASEMLSTINKFDNAVIRGEYVKRISKRLKYRSIVYLKSWIN